MNKRGFALTVAEARLLIAFASDDETREHLNAIYFDGPNGCIVATDGHALVQLSRKGRGRFLLDRCDLKEAIFGFPKTKHLTVHRWNKSDLCIRLDGNATICSETKHRFPQYQEAIPPRTRKPVLCTCIDGKLLKVAGRISEVLALSQWCVGLRLFSPEHSLSPVRIEAGDWIAAIMPMRDDEGEKLNEQFAQKRPKKRIKKPWPARRNLCSKRRKRGQVDE